MAKESVKARQRKREAMVAKYAEKRAALKASGDLKALDLLPKKFINCAFEKQVPVNRKGLKDISGILVCRGLFSATWRFQEKFLV
jgi:small subunit ribosomal protein S14